MKPDTQKFMRQAALASTVGLSVAFSVVIGAALGYWLSNLFGLPVRPTVPAAVVFRHGFGGGLS